jgi:hypothetical protein
MERKLPNANALPREAFPSHMMWGDETEPISITSVRPVQGVYKYGSPTQAKAQKEFSEREKIRNALLQISSDIVREHRNRQQASQEREGRRRSINREVENHQHSRDIADDETERSMETILSRIPADLRLRYIADSMRRSGRGEAYGDNSYRVFLRTMYGDNIYQGLPEDVAINNTVRDATQNFQQL